MRRIIAVALGLLVVAASAQSWVARYDGPASDEDLAYGIGCDDSGRVFVTGTSWGTGTGNDILTIAYGQSGESLWAQRYDGSAHNEDLARAIAVAGGRVVVTGGTTNASVLTDFVTACYSAAGAQQWAATYDGAAAGNDHGLAAAIDSSGNAYVAGYRTGDTTGWDFAVIKYNAGGSRQWVGTYSTMDEDYVTAVTADPSGNVYAAGNSGSPYTLSWDYVTVRYNATTGDTVWSRRLNGPANEDDEVRAIAVDGDGNVIVTGGTTSAATGVDYTTVKYRAADGETLWVRRYDGPGNGTDWAYALAVDASGNVYVTGSSLGSGTDMDYATVKYDENGNQQWVARYDGPAGSFDEARAIAVDASGDVYVTGGSAGSGTRDDYATVKYNASGNEVGANRYDGPASRLDDAVAIAFDATGGICVTGSSVGSISGTDYATIRCADVGIAETTNDEVRMASVWPTIVRGVLRLPTAGLQLQATCSLMDINGRKVLELHPGTNDVSRVAAGVYFVQQASTVSRVVIGE
jgi:hypothetical protein